MTAQQSIKKLDYQWTRTGLIGQYVDEHEQEDIVSYHQNIFLPGMKHVQNHTRNWDQEHGSDQPLPLPHEQHTVVWFHDESTVKI